MRSDIYMVLSLGMSLASFGLISKWYVMPQLNVVSRATVLTPLLSASPDVGTHYRRTGM